jgi:hypothetical protein
MSDANPEPNPATTAARVFGVILMIVGYLLLSAAGLCTLVVGGSILSEGFHGSDITLVLVYGGIPMILGALIAWAGHALWRSRAGS